MSLADIIEPPLPKADPTLLNETRDEYLARAEAVAGDYWNRSVQKAKAQGYRVAPRFPTTRIVNTALHYFCRETPDTIAQRYVDKPPNRTGRRDKKQLAEAKKLFDNERRRIGRGIRETALNLGLPKTTVPPPAR